MKKNLIILIVLFLGTNSFGQCNFGLNLGTVVVPSHGNSTNGGNFTNPTAWQQAANWVDSLNLDYHQVYIRWVDVVTQITGNVPTYTANFTSFQNQINAWGGSPDMHVVYPIIKVGKPNTLDSIPQGFGSFTSFLDTSYINQNYNAIKFILNNTNNVKWISIGNEIETYFGGAFLNNGQLSKYSQFLNIMKGKINTDFPTVKVGTIFAFHTLTFNSELNLIDSVINNVDFIGYTFYYTTSASSNCWAAPATVQTWLNTAKNKAGTKKMMLTETCMGNGGGIGQNCGSPLKQQNYADSLLLWYNSNISNVEGMTWFTVVDPYLGWQTPSTLWNTCGLIDSNGVTIQPAGNKWKHICSVEINENSISDSDFSIYPNPTQGLISFNLNDNTETIVKIFNSLGKELQQFILKPAEKSINISNYPEGIYYVRFENAKKVTYKRIVLCK